MFLSYQRDDEGVAVNLADELDTLGRYVFIDIHDDTLNPGEKDLDDALMKAIFNSDTMVIIVSDNTQSSWWVPWEIGVSTPFQKPRAMYKPSVGSTLPTYLQKLPRLQSSVSVNHWVLQNTGPTIARYVPQEVCILFGCIPIQGQGI